MNKFDDYTEGAITPGWWNNAACRKAPREMFFADDQGHTPYLAEARSMCAGCPSRRDCLRDAWHYEHGARLDDIVGIRGGLTQAQRRRVVQEARRRAA